MSEYIITDEQLEALRGLAADINGNEICSHIGLAEPGGRRFLVVNGEWLLAWSVSFDRLLKAVRESGTKGVVVRCRECKYHVENDTMFSFYNGTCDWWAESPKVDPDGFCAWGVRSC